MDADAKKLASLEEELRRDLDAIARVKELMARKRPPDSRQYALPIPISDKAKDSIDDLDAPAQSLRGTIENMINADPEARWTTQKVLAHLQQTGFPLKAQKPIYSVGQALQKLVDKGSIRIVRKGIGSQPNIYKALAVARQDETEDHSGGDKVNLAG